MASDAKPQDKTASAADPKADETTQQQAAAAKKPALGEDDEFEDFPVDGMSPPSFIGDNLLSMVFDEASTASALL